MSCIALSLCWYWGYIVLKIRYPPAFIQNCFDNDDNNLEVLYFLYPALLDVILAFQSQTEADFYMRSFSAIFCLVFFSGFSLFFPTVLGFWCLCFQSFPSINVLPIMLSLEHMKYNQMPIKLLMPVFTIAIILHFWQQYQMYHNIVLLQMYYYYYCIASDCSS